MRVATTLWSVALADPSVTDRLYTEHPELYDAVQSAWDYDRDVSFLLAAADRHDAASVADGRLADPPTELLEVGCGTGEHTQRLAAAGFDVTGVDPNEPMLDRARRKFPGLDARLVVGGLPSLPVTGTFPVVVAFRGVISHLPPEGLEPSVAALGDRLADDGVLVFDASRLPPTGHDAPALDVGETANGTYARIVQMQPREDGRLDWNSVVVPPEGEAFVNSRPMTPFDDREIVDALRAAGLTVETHDGFGPDDDGRTVFVATPA